ncbi:MAG TPA: glycerophosphodiester phosphodiesterase family protein [Pyrinomonadaceae bacterium]|nr:glycerophosphodiester phosphodiesterase family protein [Pyrinomonadaceae bacterium]
MNQPLIIGHRGASAVAPENTLAAFREAIRVGADGIEFDVRLTRDGVPVVIHDSSLRRTGGVAQRIADVTLAELAAVDVGSWFARKKKLPPGSFADETVPSLAEVFALFQANSSTLYLEMKCDAPAEYAPLAEACCRMIAEHALKDRVMIECFQLPALRIVKEIDAKIKTVALFEPSISNPSVLSDQSIINRATDIGAAALALHHRLARPRLIEKAKAIGLHVAVWTVDDTSWVERARTTGIDALITNDPAKLIQTPRDVL